MKRLFLDICFPARCLCCGKVLPFVHRNDFFCKRCAEKHPFRTGEHICSNCGADVYDGKCLRCKEMKFSFSRSISALPYGYARHTIHRFKYTGYDKKGIRLGKLMAYYLKTYHPDLLLEVDGVASVPLHPKKLRKRGFDQVRILGETLSEELNLPYMPNLLYRTRHTIAQSKLGGAVRRNNLADAFATVSPLPETAKDKTILLLDDIFTTGTTFEECTKVLLAAGVKEVIPFALATASPYED